MSKGRPPAPRAPPEKKALSYAKDRRNSYGENDKASRKSIPLRKALENRRVRHRTRQSIVTAAQADETHIDVAESSARQDVLRVGRWTKQPDRSLADHIREQKRLTALRAKADSADR